MANPEIIQIPRSLMEQVTSYCEQHQLRVEEAIRTYIQLGLLIDINEEKPGGLRIFIGDTAEKVSLFQQRQWSLLPDTETEEYDVFELHLNPSQLVQDLESRYPTSNISGVCTRMVELGLDLSLHIDRGSKLMYVREKEEDLERVQIFPHHT